MKRTVWWVMTCAVLVLLFAPFFAPYRQEQQNRRRAEEPPAAWRFDAGRLFVVEEGKAYAIKLWVHEDGLHLFGVDPPARIFLLGTDEFGRDIFSRFLYGGRLSLAGGLIATLLALLLGSMVGAMAGLGGRWLDAVLMRVSELFLSLPWLYLLLALRAILPLQLSNSAAFWLTVAVIGLAGWPKPARLVRGMVLSAQERAYVKVARAMGAGKAYVFVNHILPQLSGVLRTQALLIFPHFVLANMALSFLGLGAGEPAATWGGMLAGIRHFAVLESHWGRVAPAILMVLFFAGAQILGQEKDEKTLVKTAATIQ